MSPSGESELDLVEAARQCDDCLGWLDRCEAECCGVFTFALRLRSDVLFGPDEVRLHTLLDADLNRYYELHGAVVEGDWVIVPRDACVVTLDRLDVHMPCRELREDNHCRIHRTGKPAPCRNFSLENAASSDYVVMPRCLYRYKLEATSSQGAEHPRQDGAVADSTRPHE